MNENKEMIQHDYQNQLKDFYEQTQEIVSQIQQGIRIKKDIPIQINNLMSQLKPILESISQNGEIQKYNWLYLRSLIVITTRDMLLNMQKLFPYEKTAQNEGFEDELDIVLQFLCVFEQKPPFTLQRICELLIDPQKHYKSSKKILFAMEKLVNQKPSYWKSTHFAASVQYLNFLIECVIFPLALILYINHYQMDRNLYDNWEFKPIVEIQKINDSKCPSNLETFFEYSYPETSSGCDCGFGEEDENGEIDYDKLKSEHCQSSDIDEGCDEIASINSQDFGIWKGYSICGRRSEYTYRELFYEKNCTSICKGVCQTKNEQNACGNYADLISKENLTQSYFNFTLSYGIDVCYEDGDSINQYPLLESAYKCVIQSSEYAFIDEFDQYLLFEENEYPYENLPGLEYFPETPKFGLFGQKFTEYNCTIKQIDVSNFRDNYIQLVFLIALIMAGFLMGFGAIFHSAIIQNLTRKGIFKHKIYKVTWKFYCPTTFLILLHMAHLSIVGTKLGFLAHFRNTMHSYIENKCTDWSNILNLVYMRDIIDEQLMPLCIPELVLTFAAMLLEILQLCLFDRRLPETIASPTLKGRESPSKSNNFVLNFGFEKDENIEKHVLDTDNIRINRKNEQLKLYNE